MIANVLDCYIDESVGRKKDSKMITSIVHREIRKYDTITLVLSVILLFISVGWLFFGHQLIRGMYVGRSIGILNIIIGGQATHPIGYYLNMADRLVVAFSYASVTVFSILLCAISNKVSNKVLLLLIVLVGIVLRVIIATRNPLFLQGSILSDDAHYYFNISRNIALGNGIRHDSFNLTNGFQPLFVFFIVPIFKIINDKFLAINIVLLLQAGIGLIFSFFLFKIVKLISTQRIATIIVAAWAVSPYFLKIDLNGLETNAALCILCIIVYYYLKEFKYSLEPTALNYVVLGILVGLGGLARVDILLLMPVLFLDIILCNLKKNEKKDILKKILLMGGFATLIVSPWFIYNLSLLKTILPVNAQATRFMSQVFGFRFLSKPGNYFTVGQIPFMYYWETIIKGLIVIKSLLNDVFPGGLLVIVFGACLGFRVFLREIKKVSFFLLFLLVIFFAYTCYIFGQLSFVRYFISYGMAYLLLLAIAMKSISISKIMIKHRSFFTYFNTVINCIAAIVKC